jgi:hypothetical protein
MRASFRDDGAWNPRVLVLLCAPPSILDYPMVLVKFIVSWAVACWLANGFLCESTKVS